ncbi:E3 ubiquitin-protein ligase TRIM33-like isoform X2 [Physella acuta]|uniref:E3 ubiquitin-protein ligase TRIM33-like isoform X2 n=1 Tax=Physella acuta TaxID=109671 RepID=UPI0027DBA624|nr:E3 ubiquitin-protein ligase TRIM33-like isoform X2 [Physella acuta]
MWDLNNMINRCVKCGSKFTSPEKPLKLLPCLHSMCLDCLYGRTPVRRNSQHVETVVATEKPDEENKEQPVSSITTNDVEDTIKNKDEAEPDNNINKTNEELENLAESAQSSATDAPSESPKPAPTTATTSDKVDAVLSSVDNDAVNSESHINGENIEAGPSETNTSSDVDKSLSTKNKEEHEIVDIKPKPVTECPICRDPIDQPGTSLMDNMFAALDPDQASSPQTNIKHMCTACDEGEEAGSYCMQCEEWLCDSCVDAHKRVRITKDHSISPKDEVKVVTSKSPWEQLMTCKQHKQEQLKFFCEKCEKLTCRDCQLMDHKEHKYQFLDQAAEQYKARLKGSLALMGEKRAKLATSREEIEQKLHNCKEQKDNLQQEILKQADILVKGIRQAVWGVLSNLASFTDAATKRLNKEIDDVSDLVGKFDHCIQFMEDILNEGSSMSLLYSKGNVETKCRKVYHTQVDPQSLKGTLLIQYKHDVNWLLGNLNKIGAIFVNGVRYPPDKNGQAARQGPSSAYQESRSGSMTATSPHLQHMANQPIPGQRVQSDWSKFIQTVSTKNSAPPNMTMSALGGAGSLPPQLTLPSNRRPQGSSMGHSWQTPPAISGSTFPGHFVAGQLLTPHQQQQQTTRPAFTPMRLHHRPATQPAFPGQMDHRNQSMHSPPQYRMGGEASGTPRSAHSTPDPARPASAGMYDGTVRPDSGGTAMIDVKKEKRDHSPDCVIMSSSMKTERSPAFQTSPMQSETVLEMQRNLDEVIRAVPMDMSDNLEQISGPKSRSLDSGHNTPRTSPGPSHHDSGIDGMHDGPHSPTDQELRDNWQGGNSMPGFSLSQADAQGDPNDDYCACCHNGGDVLCCDKCPRVFHLQCHIPELSAVPSGSFVCTICEGDNPVSADDGKRKAPGGLTENDVKVCERILLELFCHPSSVPFQEPVNRVQVPNYYKIITQPMDFTQIKCKLQRRHHNHYHSIKGFLYDLRQVFVNCAIYNKAGSEVGKAGKIVRSLFESIVERLMPQYLSFVKENPSPCFSALQQKIDPEVSGESEPDGVSAAKRPRVDE